MHTDIQTPTQVFTVMHRGIQRHTEAYTDTVTLAHAHTQSLSIVWISSHDVIHTHITSMQTHISTITITKNNAQIWHHTHRAINSMKPLFFQESGKNLQNQDKWMSGGAGLE